MQTVSLHSKNEIAAFLRQNTLLHLYALGDLDDFFWPYTTWYALCDDHRIHQIVLLYTAGSLPILLALSDEPVEMMRTLLRSLAHLLPRRFYAHFSGDLANVFSETHQIAAHGTHAKMALLDHTRVEVVDTSEVVPLTPADVEDLQTFYQASYPGNWFDPRMLETGQYFGVRRTGKLVSAGGVHVYSPQYNAAALGNIATHPNFRGQGLATAVCAKICQLLLQTVSNIGLNVHVDNQSAITCYERLGFERIGVYGEYMLEAI